MHHKHVENKRRYVKIGCQNVASEGSKWKKTQSFNIKMSKVVPFGSLCTYFGVNVAIWCAHVPPGTLAAAKIHIFPTNFNDFINPFGVTLGCLWGHFAHFGITLGPLWDHFGVTLGSLWDHFWDHFGVTLGSLWGHFGATLGPLWDHFGVTLGSLWGHFGQWKTLWVTLGICIADVCEAIFINPYLWASSVFGCATSPRGFAPREAAQSSPIVSWLKDAYQMYIRCISKLCYLYKPVPMSELGFWLRHLASGLRPSRSSSVESDRKLT